MKVLHIIGGGDIGGAKVHVLSLVEELGKHIDVKIISLRSGVFSDDALKMGINLEVVKSRNIFSDIKKVITIVKTEGYEILHCHGTKANVFALAVKKFCKIPIVTTVHSDYKLDYMHSIVKKMTLGMINSIALRYMDFYIGVSTTFKKMLVDRNFKSGKIFVLYNGMDFDKPIKPYTREFLADKYNLKLQQQEILVGIAARLYPVKGIDTLIDAAAIVVQNNPLVRFLIGGDGEDRSMLEEKVKSLNIENNVSFLGWLTDPYELMSVVDISILTSISESFPYSILEGARCKKATVSSRVGGIPDLIDNSINGYLFEPGDKLSLAHKLLDLAGNEQKRKVFGEKIYEKASIQFSLKSMCKTQLGIYDNILKTAPAIKTVAKKHDIIISGYYGFRNVGDDAMLKAIIDNLRKYDSNVKIAVLSKQPTQTTKDYNILSVNRINIIKIYLLMRQARLFIYGGGNIIQDNTSTRSLMYYLATAWMAKHMGMKVMFYSNGIGPINKPSNIARTKKILNKADVITVREELSLKELHKMQITIPKVVLSADAALSITPNHIDGDKLLKELCIDEKGPFIGFSVRKCPGCLNDEHDHYESVIAQAADYAFTKYRLRPIFIPMQYPIDNSAIEKIIEKMNTKCFHIRNIDSVSETLALIGKLDILIAMRLHALVFAAIMGIPMAGIIYEPKVEGFLQYLGRNDVGHVKTLSFETLKKEIDFTWENRVEISEDVKEKVKLLKTKAEISAMMAIDLLNNEKPVL